MTRSVVPYRVLVVAALCMATGSARAQLISPGKLSSPHQAYEGVSNCTSCHTLGQRGSDRRLCLDCHTPLKDRIDQGVGFHGRLEDLACGTCHKEHYGRDFAIVRFDTTAFEHADTGYRLAGSHVTTFCRTCHSPSLVADREVVRFKTQAGALARTYLGLSTVCAGCHESDNPHGTQFAQTACTDCHDEADWKQTVKFDHARSRYPLTGRHVDVKCEACHEPQAAGVPVVYRGLAYAQCSTCHTDPHAGRLGTVCSSCHATRSWQPSTGTAFESTFDHSRTGFELVGIHETAACESCHKPGFTKSVTVRMTFAATSTRRTYAIPDHDTCATCHVDVHTGDLPHRGLTGACTDCHGEQTWTPSRFDLARHGRETNFALEGAHITVPCSGCHTVRPEQGAHAFARPDRTCVSCHAEDDKHGTQFMTGGLLPACTTCHTVEDWSLPDYDHSKTRFALDGRHAVVECASCHKTDVAGAPVPFRGLSTNCASCHADVHAGQFEPRTCETCHDTQAFRMRSFDHSKTRFPLDGAHASVACTACHKTETRDDAVQFIRFRPLDTRCIACHPS